MGITPVLKNSPHFFNSKAQAQSETDQIIVDVSPENPGPQDTVDISISSYVTDLNRATISWRLNDRSVAKGPGVKDFSFIIGQSGDVAKVDISINTEEGTSFSKRMYIQASDLDVLWQAIDSYTPPFYKGKSFPASESYVKFFAVPNSGDGQLDQKNTVYTWKQNFDSSTTSSGYNKNTFLFQFDYLGDQNNTITVNAESKDRGYTASKSLSIKPYNPEIILYPYSDKDGILLENALGSSFTMKGRAKIIAVPYFFSPINPLSNSLQYAWKINGSDFGASEANNIINIETSGGGSARLDLNIVNQSTYYQSVSKSATIQL